MILVIFPFKHIQKQVCIIIFGKRLDHFLIVLAIPRNGGSWQFDCYKLECVRPVATIPVMLTNSQTRDVKLFKYMKCSNISKPKKKKKMDCLLSKYCCPGHPSFSLNSHQSLSDGMGCYLVKVIILL